MLTASKWEANRCKFNNDATTIRIFLKGLKNAHTLATNTKKGPQSLADTIKEVKKLQAAQQITSTLIRTSSVNTMSSDNDKCFQCQETCHIAHYCPHIRCFDCNKYGHVAADCPDKIPPSGTHQHTAETTPPVGMTDHHLGIIATPGIPTMIIGTDRFSHSQSCSHNLRYRSNSHHDSCRSCSRSFHRPSCHSSLCHRSSSSCRYCHNTPHCRS